MGNLRSNRRSFRKTQEQYVVARMKQLNAHEHNMDKGTPGGTGQEGDVRPKRFDKFNPDGEFPVSTTVPRGVQELAKHLTKIGGGGGKQDGSAGEAEAVADGAVQEDRKGEAQDQAGAGQ